METLELGNRDKDNNSLLSTLDVNLLGRRDLERAQFSLEFGDVVLQVNQGLGDADFGLIRGCLGHVSLRKGLDGISSVALLVGKKKPIAELMNKSRTILIKSCQSAWYMSSVFSEAKEHFEQVKQHSIKLYVD